jgi:ABC-type Fe3+/spermidine/putrescine transport system ATPase subunit
VVLGLLESPAAGEVRFRGTAVAPRAALAVRRRMASVFQEALLADTTVRENVPWACAFAASAAQARRARWESGSGGSASRTSPSAGRGRSRAVRRSARRWRGPRDGAGGPAARRAVLLARSPTREALIDDLGRILREERTTAVLVTHDRGEAMALGDRVGVLMDGRLLQLDDAAQVFRAPATEEIARFVGVETILDCGWWKALGICRCSTPGGNGSRWRRPARRANGCAYACERRT